MKKVVLVTGASGGIGLETSLNLLKKGMIVYGAARRTELLKPIEENGGKALFLDLTDSKSISECVRQVIKNEGHIDVLVNNAGFGLGGSIEDIPLQDAKNQFDVNVFGLTEMTKAVIPFMRKEHSGTIINISSIAGRFSSPFLGWYHASKYAVEALSDSMRMELWPFGINVSIVEPGLIRTDWGKIAGKNIRKFSQNGEYSYNADKVAEYYEKYYSKENKRIANPKVISNVITKAVLSKKPKTRYRAGTFALFYTESKKFLSDRFFDFCMKIMMKQKGIKK